MTKKSIWQISHSVFIFDREDGRDWGGLRSLRSLRTLPTFPAWSNDHLSPSGPSRCPCPRVDTPPQSLPSSLMKILYSRPVTWFDVSMSRKCHNNGKLPVFEYLRSMNPSYCVTEVRMLKNANLLFPLIRKTGYFIVAPRWLIYNDITMMSAANCLVDLWESLQKNHGLFMRGPNLRACW